MASSTTDRRLGLTGATAFKAPCVAATTAAITLSALQSIDGYTTVAGDRILVKNQTDQTTNGIYVADTGTWTRDLDADGNEDFVDGTEVYIASGSTNAGYVFALSAVNPVVIGSSVLTWNPGLFSGFANATFLQAGTGAVSRNAQTKMRDIVSVKDFGAVGDGTTDDQVAINLALASGAGAVYFPSATYAVGQELLVPSNVHVYGDAGSTTVKALSSLAASASWNSALSATAYFLMTNNNYSGSNSGITIQNMSFDMTLKDVAASACIMLRNTDGSKVVGCNTNAGDDGVAFTLGTNFFVNNCYSTKHANAAIDVYETSKDGIIMSNNVVGGSSRTSNYGIVITGLTALNIAATTQRIKVIGNSVSTVALTGIWLQGGVVGGQTGVCQNCIVSNNVINSVTAAHGIRASEGGLHLISTNRIANTGLAGILLQGEAATGAPVKNLISHNVINNANQTSTINTNAIDIQPGAAPLLTTIVGNVVDGTTHSYALNFAATVTGCRQFGNIFAAGTSGVINDSGTGNQLPAFLVTDSSGTAYGSGPTTVKFSTENYDHGNNVSSGIFTAPKSGEHRVEFRLTHSSTATTSDHWQITLNCSGSTVTAATYNWFYNVAIAQKNTVIGAQSFQMTSGDNAYLSITRTSGSGNFQLSTDPTFNSFSGSLVDEYI